MMRFSVLSSLAFLTLGSIFAFAQDAATMAGIQATEQANRDAIQASQQAGDAAQRVDSVAAGYPFAAAPVFSVKGGTYQSPVAVRLKSKTRGAVIYYTTDGWTPTAASIRYTGPITISSTTTLQAIAVAPHCIRSIVGTEVYTLPALQEAKSSSVFVAPISESGVPNLVLPKGLEIPLIVTSPVSSKTAEVGDAVSLELAADIKAGDQVLAPKGSPVTGKVIQVDHSGMAGQPGDLTFMVQSINLNGKTVELSGERTKEGLNKMKKARSIGLIPGVGMSAFFLRGEEASIEKGTPLMVQVAKDTVLAQ